MTSRPSKGKFRGDLAKPISGRPLINAMAKTADKPPSPETLKIVEDAMVPIQWDWHSKIKLLAEHYHVDLKLPDEIRNLFVLIELAQDFVPGFRIDMDVESRPRRGRPRQVPWRMIYDFALLRQVGIGPADAKRKLHREGRWKGKVPSGINARYSEFQKRGTMAELASLADAENRTE